MLQHRDCRTSLDFSDRLLPATRCSWPLPRRHNRFGCNPVPRPCKQEPLSYWASAQPSRGLPRSQPAHRTIFTTPGQPRICVAKEGEVWFKKSKTGRHRSTWIVPTPFFVSCDMTYPVQAADLAFIVLIGDSGCQVVGWMLLCGKKLQMNSSHGSIGYNSGDKGIGTEKFTRNSGLFSFPTLTRPAEPVK